MRSSSAFRIKVDRRFSLGFSLVFECWHSTASMTGTLHLDLDLDLDLDCLAL